MGMSSICVSHPTAKLIGRINITGSKSESNRALLLKALFLPTMNIQNLSESKDTQVLQTALRAQTKEVNIGDAGTAMRFLTAYYAAQEGKEVVLTGSTRMQQRPIGLLVEALRNLGANIVYLEREGFPPLQISGTTLTGTEIEISGNVSSQFITALMLIAPVLKTGLTIKIKGFSVSTPYIYLTASLMNRLGFSIQVKGEHIYIQPVNHASLKQHLRIEPDWSSASYWFSMALLAKQAEVFLPYFREISMQGDAAVKGLFEPLGVEAIYLGNGYRLKKIAAKNHKTIKLNLLHTPDLAQTLAVALSAVGQKATLNGLQTLTIKETDRLLALKTELEKFGAKIEISQNSLHIYEGIKPNKNGQIGTWGDHRMAMAFAPLALLNPVIIEAPEVVQKSYPGFWEDLKKIGFTLD